MDSNDDMRDARASAETGAMGMAVGRPWSGPERRSRSQGAAMDALLPVLDAFDHGVLLVDVHLRCVHANQSARAWLRQPQPLRVERGQVLALSLPDTQLLAAAVRDAASRRLRRMLHLGEGAQRVALSVVPLPLGWGQAAPAGSVRHAAQAMVMLPRQRLCEPLSLHGFARDHGLSPHERTVLEFLCHGLQPSEIAERQAVALSTVRTQIASVRQKVGAASVADLLQRVAQLPPVCGTLQPELCADGGSVHGTTH